MAVNSYGYLEYTVCNEHLGSVVRGLDANKNDIVLAIGSSGDQAFALLESAGRVISSGS